MKITIQFDGYPCKCNPNSMRAGIGCVPGIGFLTTPTFHVWLRCVKEYGGCGAETQQVISKGNTEFEVIVSKLSETEKALR
jgi:hypothetical protein